MRCNIPILFQALLCTVLVASAPVHTQREALVKRPAIEDVVNTVDRLYRAESSYTY